MVEAALPVGFKTLVRHAIPAAAILLPLAFFHPVLSPDAQEPSATIYLTYVGALTVGLLALGVGLVRRRGE